MASTYNLDILQGNTFSIRVNASNEDGSLINLQGYTSSGHIRYNYGSSGYLLDLAPQIHNSYVSGIVDIILTSQETAALPVGCFPYDLEAISSGGATTTKFLKGYASVSPEATH